MNKKPKSYLALLLLSCAVLYFALDLSKEDRGTVDYVVLLLISGAIMYNVIRLARRLFAAGGLKDVWHLIRTMGFWAIGLLNTALARSSDVGSWKYWLGWGVLGLAVYDTYAIFRKERSAMASVSTAAVRDPESPNDETTTNPASEDDGRATAPVA